MAKMLEVTLRSDLQKLHAALKSRPQEIVSALTGRLNRVMTMLASYIVREKLSGQILRRRTGILAGSVHAVPATIQGTQIIGKVVAGEGPSNLYAAVHEYGGSRAYEIMSVKSRALAFMMDGRMRFFSRVNHPATMARPFMAPSLQENESSIREQLQQALDEELERPA